MNALPEPRPTTTDGQREPTAQEIADQLIAAVNQAITQPTEPAPAREPAPRLPPPPVPQPGIPPMDQKLVQIGRLSLYVGCATVPPGLVASLFMVSTGFANPSVFGWAAAAVGSIAIPIGAVGYAVKRIAAAAPPPEVTNNYTGPVEHNETNVTTTNRWGGTTTTNFHRPAGD